MSIDVCLDGWMDGCINVSMVHVYGCVYGHVYRCIQGWIDEHMIVCLKNMTNFICMDGFMCG